MLLSAADSDRQCREIAVLHYAACSICLDGSFFFFIYSRNLRYTAVSRTRLARVAGWLQKFGEVGEARFGRTLGGLSLIQPDSWPCRCICAVPKRCSSRGMLALAANRSGAQQDEGWAIAICSQCRRLVQ